MFAHAIPISTAPHDQRRSKYYFELGDDAKERPWSMNAGTGASKREKLQFQVTPSSYVEMESSRGSNLE
jgi:hypothetical protein